MKFLIIVMTLSYMSLSAADCSSQFDLGQKRYNKAKLAIDAGKSALVAAQEEDSYQDRDRDLVCEYALDSYDKYSEAKNHLADTLDNYAIAAKECSDNENRKRASDNFYQRTDDVEIMRITLRKICSRLKKLNCNTGC
jgi:hypothetical protein